MSLQAAPPAEFAYAGKYFFFLTVFLPHGKSWLTPIISHEQASGFLLIKSPSDWKMANR